MHDVWDEVETLKEEIASLVQDRMRTSTGHNVMADSDDTEGSAQPSANSDSFKPLRHDQPAEMNPFNTSGSSSPNKGKEVGLPRKLMPAFRFFPIDASKDAALIASWQDQVLPNIEPLLCDGEDTGLSMTLLRQGKTAEDSEPVVRIQTSKPRSEERQGEIVRSITQLLLPVPSPRIFFVIGSIKRTARRSDLDILPRAARNSAFLRRPPMGVSIGIEGSVKDTATLGGYIYIDGMPHILTVHHLFTDDETGEVFKPGTAITQPSLQEVKELGEMWDRLRSSGECFHLECVKKAFEDLKACLPEFSFGRLEKSSGYRNRSSRDGTWNVEMDWAICKVEKRRIGSNISPCESHLCQETSPVTPGGAVLAIGRTSGQQNGNINGCTTSLFLRNDDGSYRESEEWAVLRPESQGEETWMKNGIGVSGDSGAWILEDGTDNLVGQVWGRDFQDGGSGIDNGEIITYFTPIQDIFDDILESTGATEISIMSNRKSNKEDKQKGKRNEFALQSSTSQTSSQLSGGNRIRPSVNSGSSTAFMVAAEENTADCNLCVNLKKCICLKICRLDILMKPASKTNICCICHENVNPNLSENVRSPPRQSSTSGMMFGTGQTASIAAAYQVTDALEREIAVLADQKYEQSMSLS